MSIFWIGGPEGIIVPTENIKATEDDRYFMPGILHGTEDYILQSYYWSNGEGPENDRIGIKYLWASSVLEWAQEATNKDGSLNEAIFAELINEHAEEFVVENDGTGDFVSINEVWDQALALSYTDVIAWAQYTINKDKLPSARAQENVRTKPSLDNMITAASHKTNQFCSMDANSKSMESER